MVLHTFVVPFPPELSLLLDATEDRGVVLSIERGEREGRTLENHSVHVWQLHDGKGARFRGYNEETWDEFWS